MRPATFSRVSSGQVPVRVAYATAAFARGLSRCFAEMFLGYHLHARAGLSSFETGVILLALLSAGAIADLAAGLLLRRYQSSRGAVFAMQRIGAVFAAIALVPLFLPGIGVPGALLWGGMFRIALSFYSVPQTTLLAILPADVEERRRYVTLHAAAGAAARVVTAGTAFLVVGSATVMGAAFHLGWVVALALSGIATVLVLERIARTSGRGELREIGEADGRTWPVGLTWLLASTVFHAGALFMMSRLFLFAPHEVGAASSGPWLLTAWTCGLTIGPFLRSRFGRASFPLSVAIAATTSGVLLIPGLPPPVALLAALAYGVGLSASGADLLGAISQLVRKGSGVSAGPVFAAFAFVTKIAMAAGNGSLAFFLDGYAADNRSTYAALAAVSLLGGLLCVLAWSRADRGRFHRAGAAARRREPDAEVALLEPAAGSARA